MNQTKPPTHASWESTLSCPLCCKHCGLSAGKPRPDEMSTQESMSMLSSLSDFGIKHLIISGGEFSSRTDWLSILKFALPLFNTVRIITCGWLEEKLFAQLAEIKNLENLIVSVSLDGAETEHDFRRGEGSFQSVMKTLTFETTIPRTVLTTVDNRNIYNLIEVIRICLKFHVTQLSIQISLPAGRMNPNLFLGKEKIQLLAELLTKWKKVFGHKLGIEPDDCFANLFPIRDIGHWPGCHAGKELITIFSNGLVTGCPTMTGFIAGDIKEQNITEIWSSEIMEKLRTQVPGECATCGICPGGCKAVSQLFKQQFCLTK